MGTFGRSSKWLIEHHGDALLRLAGVKGLRSWRSSGRPNCPMGYLRWN